MSPKTLASTVCFGLFALIAFGSGVPNGGHIAVRSGTASALETARPVSDSPILEPPIVGPEIVASETLEPNDDVVLRAGAPQLAAHPPDACMDSIANCGDPVRYMGTQNDCTCFACAYGTPSQRTVCTKNAADKKALFNRSK